MNFREEAIILVKEILADWNDNQDFERVVTILEDYLTDQDTFFAARLQQINT